MEYGISKLSIIPGRDKPSDKSEIVTQILFGEHYTIIKNQEKWIKIKLAHDSYTCWIDKKQHCQLTEKDFQYLEENPAPRTLDLLGIAKDKYQETYYNLPLGSRLPFYKKGKFKIKQSKFRFKGTLAKQKSKNLLPYAYIYLNAPYLWGGRTPFGIDCSGFTQMCYALIGIQIPRDAFQQAGLGETIKELSDIQPGDLAFFKNDKKKITHVGIMLNQEEIIHASGKVRVDTMDKRGIFNAEMRGYSHNLDRIKRLL